MLPHSLSKTNVSLGRPFGDDERPDFDENEINDYFNDNGVILEDEEEYDILNDETFGESLGDSPDEPNDVELKPSWEDYDLHNDETFGEEISYDWESEHEKMLSVLEDKDGDTPKKSDPVRENFGKKLPQNQVKLETVHQNGFRDVHSNNSYLGSDDLGGALLKTNSGTNERVSNLESLDSDELPQLAKRDFDGRFSCTKTLTNENCSPLLRNDKWYRDESHGKRTDDSIKPNYNNFSQDYSLFPSSTNILQNAGIHIPSIPSAAAQKTYDSENLQRKLEALKLQQQQSSASSIPSVADLEKQWINDAASKSVITADCFRAYNSAFFVNKGSSATSSTNSISSPMTSRSKTPMEASFMSADTFRNETATPLNLPYQKMMSSPSPFAQQGFPPPPPPPSIINGDCDHPGMYGKLTPNRVPSMHPFEHKPFTIPVMTEKGVVMCDESIFMNPNFAEMNARIIGPYINNQVINRTKPHPGNDPPVIVSSDPLARRIEPSMLIDNANLPRVGVNVFQPPPGLTIDPAKLRHFQNTAAMHPRPPPITSCLAMQPIQVLNGIVAAEQQKLLMKFQKEEYLSVVDEYAGMMTEREKYWLAGVQLLQINAMDPFKDDYYFTNYQARRKGNRGKNQTNNNNNKRWQNEHTKDYSPLQFENSLGKVQVGSVVAPRKVIDTDIFESSPKHNGKLNDSLGEDPIANTSHRKRRAIMLHIENLYGKVIALESLQVTSAKNKTDPATVKAESESIVNSLREELINLKDDFKIVMSIRKGKRLVWKFLMFCDNPEAVWFQIFEILDRIIRGDLEHCILLSYLPYFRTWLTTISLGTMCRLSKYFTKNLHFYFRDKFTVSMMANMIEQAELIYFYSKTEDQIDWMDFIVTLAHNAHQSLDNVQKPVVSVKPQMLRSHLLRCEKLENGYVSYLLKIFSNNMRK